ncbi:MAG: hypothetical protein GWP08_17690 [Nitrospiraceae bacterium]|nr:hypothetical protein [Nitrospiraceae bacterium]
MKISSKSSRVPFSSMVVTAAMLVFTLVGTANADVLFSSGFEGWSFAGWTDTSGSGFTGTYVYEGSVAGEQNKSDVLLKAQSTVGFTNIVLKYARRTRSMEPNDHFLIEWFDGSTWTTLEDLSGSCCNTYELKTWNLPAAASENANFQVRFAQQNNRLFDFVYVDAVEISGTPSGGSPPGAASNPSPADGATGVSVDPILSWTAGSGATSHDVYFGTVSPPPFAQNQTDTSVQATGLANATLYFWRIDEVNGSGTTTGPEWSFTTASAGGAQQLYFDGFESGDFVAGGWNISGAAVVSTNNPFTGTFHAHIDSTDWIQQIKDLSGFTNIEVRYARNVTNFESGDQLLIAWFDGTDWNTLEDLTADSPYTQKSFNLPAGADNNPDFQLVFQSFSDVGDDAFVDDVEILGVPSGGGGPASPIFDDGFENADVFEDLFPLDGSRWFNYIEDTGNTIDLEKTSPVHSGTQSLFCFALKYGGTNASKAMISKDDLTFANGDKVWTEQWVYLLGGTDTLSVFLWDLEAPATCTDAVSCPNEGAGTICNSPGRRLFLSGPTGEWLKSDMGKWCVGDEFFQTPGQELAFPKDQWVRLRVYMELSDTTSGVMKVWQNNDLVLDATGITLPRADSIFSRIQVGITANGNEVDDNTMWVDDVKIWDQDPQW